MYNNYDNILGISPNRFNNYDDILGFSPGGFVDFSSNPMLSKEIGNKITNSNSNFNQISNTQHKNTCDSFVNETACKKLRFDNKGDNMSILTTETVNNHIIFAADSRSSRVVNGEKLSFEVDDNFCKIVYSKDFNLIIGSTGMNEFNDMTFSEIANICIDSTVRNLSANPNNNLFNNQICITNFLNEFNQLIQSFVDISGMSVNLIYGYYSHENRFGINLILPQICIFAISPSQQINSAIWGAPKKYLSTGEDYARTFLDNCRTPLNDNPRQHYGNLKRVLEQLICLENENFSNAVIGGDVQGIIINEKGIVLDNLL